MLVARSDRAEHRFSTVESAAPDRTHHGPFSTFVEPLLVAFCNGSNNRLVWRNVEARPFFSHLAMTLPIPIGLL